MVYGFVKQSGGHIRIATEVGAGTCVSLLLPRADSAADIAACGNDGPHPRNAGELILLVESDDDSRIAIRRDLLELGYTVIEARDGVEAEGLLRTIADVRVLVADAAMPGGVPGQALAALARQQRPDLKIVLIGGGDTEGAGPSKGDLACLHKPVEKGDVMRVIERWERTTPSTRG
jgi:CheY-like chemotaxis protein